MIKFRFNSEKKKPPVKDEVDLVKRSLLRGIAGGLTAPLVFPLARAIQKLEEPVDIVDREVGQPLAGDEVAPDAEAQYEESNSAYFEGKVQPNLSLIERDMPVILDSVEVIAAIHNNFKLPGISSVLVRKELESLALSIGVVESRLKADALNHETKAFSFMQIEPGTWDDLAKEGESKDSVDDVVKVAARLMEQTYQHIVGTCQSELDQIRDVFFDGDVASFEENFLCPVIGNAYNAGMGSLAKLVKWFAKTFPTKESTLAMFDEVYILTGQDVFLGMTEQAKVQGDVVKWYKEDSLEYTPKVYASKRVLGKYFVDETT